MTEQEWLACTDPHKLLCRLGGAASSRKLRLFACACVRAVWGLLTDERSRQAVALAEQFADGAVTRKELAEAPARALAQEAREGLIRATGACFAAAGAARKTLLRTARKAANDAAQSAAQAQYTFGAAGWEAARAAAESTQAALLRDILGNPFRPVTLAPAWLTADVVSLTRAAYETGDFSGLPALADALEEAGCDNADLLNHLRGEGPHVRGCWAVDGCLGKS